METILDIATIGGAAMVAYLSYMWSMKAQAGYKSLAMAVMLSAVVLGLAELLDILQLFPDGTVMGQIVYEKELIVIALLGWGVMELKK